MRVKAIKALSVVIHDDHDFFPFHLCVDTSGFATPLREMDHDVFIGARTSGFDKKRLALGYSGCPEVSFSKAG